MSPLTTGTMTYAGTGVDYGSMDPFKIAAQKMAAHTDHLLARFGFEPVPWSRGESVFVIKTPFGYIGLVVEGLGSKSLVADDFAQIVNGLESPSEDSFYDHIAQCNVAMAINDLITLGLRPVIYNQYLAVGDSDWFNNTTRSTKLAEGTRNACIRSGCVWGGGETPTLKGIVNPETADLAGAAFGILTDEDHLINPAKIRPGDSIILIGSSGIHANGLTLARKIAKKLPKGYATDIGNGMMYGRALLEPTIIYAPLIEQCQSIGINIHGGINITGHGWRKLMRANQPFIYEIDRIPDPQPVFRFIQKHGPVDDKEAYGNLNMGAGFALYVDPKQENSTIELARSIGFWAINAGHIKESEDGKKRVLINPLNITFEEEELSIR